jgi:hypothetical protein
MKIRKGYVYKDKTTGFWYARITATDERGKRKDIKKRASGKTQAPLTFLLLPSYFLWPSALLASEMETQAMMEEEASAHPAAATDSSINGPIRESRTLP